MSPKVCIIIQYTTQIWEQIAFKIPSRLPVTIASACLDCLLGSGMTGGAICASKHKSTPHFFNRVLNGISSRSGNNITHTHAYIHTHARTPSTSSSSTAEKRRRALIQQGREVSQPPWKPERRSWRRGGSKALEDSSQTHGKLQGQNIYTYIYIYI